MILIATLLIISYVLAFLLGYKQGRHKEKQAYIDENVKRDTAIANIKKLIELLKNEAQ